MPSVRTSTVFWGQKISPGGVWKLGVARLGDPTLPSAAHTHSPHSLTGEERRSNSPCPAFQTGATVLVKPRISMEIETSFFRGPLLTSPSASVLENQSLGCALRTDDPFIPSPDRWQLQERFCWTLCHSVVHVGHHGLSQPAWMPEEQIRTKWELSSPSPFYSFPPSSLLSLVFLPTLFSV